MPPGPSGAIGWIPPGPRGAIGWIPPGPSGAIGCIPPGPSGCGPIGFIILSPLGPSIGTGRFGSTTIGPEI